MQKRKTKFSLLCLGVGLSLSGTAFAAEADELSDVTGTTGFAQCSEYLNVRSSASQDGEIVGKLYNNGSVEILEVDENGWYHIHSGNVDGYVASQYIATGAEADAIAAEAGYTTAEVGAISLNVRADADEASDVVGAANESEELEVVADYGDWVKVVLSDGATYGYVSSEYVYVSTEYPTALTLEEDAARQAAQNGSADAGTSAENTYTENNDTENSNTEDAYTEDAYTEDTSSGNYTEDTSDSNTEDTYYEESGEDTYYDDTYTKDTSTGDSYTEDTSAGDSYTEDTSTGDASGDSDTSYSEDTSDGDTSSGDAYTGDTSTGDASGDSYSGDSDTSYSEDTSTGDTSSDDTYYEETEDTTYQDTTADDTYTEDTSSADTSSSSSSTGQAIANYACQFVGNPYVWGGTSLTSGADCSGFVLSVFANFGISLPHSAAAQAGYGTEVSYSDLQPGDLLFYSDGSGISHVAIYIGGGSIVHAANSSSGICYSNADYSTPVSCRRLV